MIYSVEHAKEYYRRRLNNEIALMQHVLAEMRRSPGDHYDLHLQRIDTLAKHLPELRRFMLWYKNIYGGAPSMPPVSGPENGGGPPPKSA